VLVALGQLELRQSGLRLVSMLAGGEIRLFRFGIITGETKQLFQQIYADRADPATENRSRACRASSMASSRHRAAAGSAR
jgi:hypothetical protein